MHNKQLLTDKLHNCDTNFRFLDYFRQANQQHLLSRQTKQTSRPKCAVYSDNAVVFSKTCAILSRLKEILTCFFAFNRTYRHQINEVCLSIDIILFSILPVILVCLRFMGNILSRNSTAIVTIKMAIGTRLLLVGALVCARVRK